MKNGSLDEIGERIFTLSKVRKALDRLFIDPPKPLLRLIRSTINDDSIRPAQIKNALKNLWDQTSEVEPLSPLKSTSERKRPRPSMPRRQDYTEEHHIKGQPQEVVELFRSLDKFCLELDRTHVTRTYRAKSINYSHGKNIFCCVHLRKSGLRVWLKLRYMDLKSPPDYVRDVSSIGHWGTGDVELAINTFNRLQDAKALIKKAFEKNISG